MALIPTQVSEMPSPPTSGQCSKVWLPELIILVGIVIVTTLIFWLFPLDLTVSEWFRAARNGVSWPIGHQEPWFFLNEKGDIYLTSFLITLPILILITSPFIQRCKKLRCYALFILAAVIIGPGLLINVGFKDHLGRPRPMEIENFGGKHEYVALLHSGSAGTNSSFPSGHAASGFCYVVFWFIWRHRYPRLAILALTGSLILGGVMSFARVASGAHFLSDVLWSGYFCYFSTFILYYFVLRIPRYKTLQEAQQHFSSNN